MKATLDTTVDYLRTRRQFGQPIGRFQAIQHKLADGLMALEGVRLALAQAALACDTGRPGWRYAAAAECVRVAGSPEQSDPDVRSRLLSTVAAVLWGGIAWEAHEFRDFRREMRTRAHLGSAHPDVVAGLGSLCPGGGAPAASARPGVP